MQQRVAQEKNQANQRHRKLVVEAQQVLGQGSNN